MQQYSASLKASDSNLGLYIKLGLLAIFFVLIIWVIATKKWKAFIAKIKGIVKGVGEGLTSALKLKQKNLFIVYSISIWVLYLTGTWVGLYATTGTGVGFSAAVSCLAFASIGMIITPGGIGSYALFIAFVLELNKVDYFLGLANGTLQWFAQFLIILLVGFVCVILLPIYNKKRAL
jgi:hypothetical protein